MSECRIECAKCGTSVPINKMARAQRYCAECSLKVKRERHATWRKTKRVERFAESAAENSGDASVAWSPSEMAPSLLWLVRFKVPFTYGMSKNATWSMNTKSGHVYVNKRATGAKAMVRDALAASLARSDIKPVHAKVYIDIFVQKPNHRGDAVNVVDTVCDGVKEALGIDDRWFSIRGVDWEVVKSDPVVIIGVGQASDQDHRVCSSCGRVRPLDDFGIRSADKLGRARWCVSCARPRKVSA